jgi:citrate lyase subunit beta/citryl-CoA lyase
MSKKYPGPWIMRTMLFTSGASQKYITKAFETAADCIVLDLEDAVPESEKQTARVMTRDTLGSSLLDKRPVFVRINPMETGHTLIDLEAVACEQLSGFVYPKAYSAKDVEAFSAQLALMEMKLGLPRGHFEVVVLIETPQAVLSAFEIARSSSRVIGLLYGCEDYLTDMRGSHGPAGRSLLVPRHLVAMAARGVGILPIDTPFVKVHDAHGLEEHMQQAKELGFEGMLAMSPRQIEVARMNFSVTAAEREWAQQIRDAAAETGRGISVRQDLFVSPPTLRRAKNMLERWDHILKFEKEVLGASID